jgi:hypothetical protein
MSKFLNMHEFVTAVGYGVMGNSWMLEKSSAQNRAEEAGRACNLGLSDAWDDVSVEGAVRAKALLRMQQEVEKEGNIDGAGQHQDSHSKSPAGAH